MLSREFRAHVLGLLKLGNIDVPALEANLLIGSVTRRSRTDMVLNADEEINQQDVSRVEALVERRLSGEPMDHILGYREFYGRRFDISKHVLSPRPETEELVVKALERLEGIENPKILDLGTGSGAIIITLLTECLQATGCAVDISEKALEVATRNAQTHEVTERLSLIQGSWFENVKERFDMIVSNPPYITDAAMVELSTEVWEYDPDVSLRGGEDGLEAYRLITKQAGQHLKPGSILLFEIGYDQGESVPKLMRQAGFSSIQVEKDLSNHDRIVIGELSGELCDK